MQYLVCECDKNAFTPIGLLGDRLCCPSIRNQTYKSTTVGLHAFPTCRIRIHGILPLLDTRTLLLALRIDKRRYIANRVSKHSLFINTPSDESYHDLGHHLGVAKVQVRLRVQECVVVVSIPACVECPCRVTIAVQLWGDSKNTYLLIRDVY